MGKGCVYPWMSRQFISRPYRNICGFGTLLTGTSGTYRSALKPMEEEDMVNYSSTKQFLAFEWAMTERKCWYLFGPQDVVAMLPVQQGPALRPAELCGARAEEEETGTPHQRHARRRLYRPVLPFIIMGNVRSLPNKMDELAALTGHEASLPAKEVHTCPRCGCVPPPPPSPANADAACDVLLSAVSRLQTQHPVALLLISGDFNHAPPSSSLPKFTQYITCHTRDNKTLDLFYTNIKEAYHSLPLPPLGRADHNLVHLHPVYQPLVQRQPAVTCKLKKWSEEAEEALKDCFNTTRGMTVWSFPNSKPWITPYIKALLKEKKRAFVSGDKEELKYAEGTEEEDQAGERQLQQEDGEPTTAEQHLRGLEGSEDHLGLQGAEVPTCGRPGWAIDLNLFFNRFDQAPTPPPALLQPPPLLSLTTHQVRKALKKNRARKATGPDGISSRLLKSCADQLAFNTIQPRLLGNKLQVAGVDHHLTTWILDYLTQRPQFVRVKGSESDRLLCSTEVLTTLLLSASSLMGTTEYRGLIQDFVDWGLRNNLQINGNKTKELVVDLHRCNNPLPAPVNILGTDVDVVKSYKYLGVHLNNNLDWTHNTPCQEGQ
ncbi:hypothetical protein D4764_04G0014540 [Takifugu flavidus]|uniref:Uncharacterized protein n=1 Tax=Takifugu flavidus TaxID=433684 RepID=A0A5C6NAY3_9TELE|nr:hypothetical protein D4764_04G0014540 [Takifugu flavidus]